MNLKIYKHIISFREETYLGISIDVTIMNLIFKTLWGFTDMLSMWKGRNTNGKRDGPYEKRVCDVPSERVTEVWKRVPVIEFLQKGLWWSKQGRGFVPLMIDKKDKIKKGS